MPVFRERRMNPVPAAMLKAIFARRADIGVGVRELLALMDGGS